jgi:rhamnosyl/mannosyltransferase
LKILHIGKYFPPFSGGLENYMHDMMVALGKRGVGSAALVHRHHWSLRSLAETYSIGGEEFQIVRTGRIAKLLFAPISPAFPWHLRSMIKSIQPDALHIHMPNPSAFWALIFPPARRIPWVVHWHADVITAEQGWLMKLMYALYRPFEQALLKHSKAIVVTSQPYLESSEPLRRWKSRCRVVPLGVDTGRFTAARTLEAAAANSGQESLLRVLYVGRLTYYKGVRHLVEAAATVEGLHLDLVGDGDQLGGLKSLVASLQLQDRVIFHGSLTDGELAHLMAKCDCLCLPSIERTEAFGLVLLEAMYFGKATVISDVPGSGMGWIVDHGVTGIKVKPRDPAALAEAFLQLSANRDRSAQMGRRGKEKFEQEFEINRAVDGIIDTYRSVIPSE